MNARTTLAVAAGLSFGLGGGVGAQDPSATYPWLSYRLTAGGDQPVALGPLGLSDDRRKELTAAGHGAAELLNRHELEIGADVIRVRTVRVRHFLTEEGLRQMGNFEFRVSANRTEAAIEAMYVVLPDGEVFDVARETVQISNDAEPDIFSDTFTVTVPVSRLEVGATAVLITTQDRVISSWPLPWSHLFLTRGVSPIESFELRIGWEPTVPRPLVANGGELECDESEASIACSSGPQPAIQFDPDMSSVWDVIPQIVVTGNQDWGEIATSELAIVDASLGDDAGVTPILEQILVGSENDLDRLRRIHRFVADEIRYVGFEHGVSAVAPRPARTTLARRYGDCKDKVVLFLAMARAAGFDSLPVLVATDRYDVGKLTAPSWKYFNHMIACVDTPAARFGAGLPAQTCIDLTAPYLKTGALPVSLLGAVSLDLTDGVEAPGTLSAPEHGWTVELEMMNEVGCGDELTEMLQRTYVGSAAGAMRGFLLGLTEDQRLRWAEEGYREVMGDTASPEFEFNGLDDAEADVVIVSRAEYPWSEAWNEVSEPDIWLQSIGSVYTSENAHHPYLHFGVRVESRVSYRFCDSREPRFIGAALDFESEFGRLTRSYEIADNEVRVRTLLDVPRKRLEVARLERYNRFLLGALGQTGIWFSVEPVEAPK